MEAPGTNTQRPSSSFEGHRLADIHIHCSHLIIPFVMFTDVTHKHAQEGVMSLKSMEEKNMN